MLSDFCHFVVAEERGLTRLFSLFTKGEKHFQPKNGQNRTQMDYFPHYTAAIFAQNAISSVLIWISWGLSKLYFPLNFG